MFDIEIVGKIRRNRQMVITVLLFGMLVGDGFVSAYFENLIFYAVVFSVALISYTRNIYLNVLLALSTVFFMLAWMNSFDVVRYNIVYCVSSLMCLFYGIYSTIRFVLGARNIFRDEVFALVNCYVIVGFSCALLYALIENIAPGSFSITSRHHRLMDDFIYFSFVTMTTVGYGDILPGTILTQRLSVAQAIFGQFYFALVVAYLLNKLFKQREEGGG